MLIRTCVTFDCAAVNAFGPSWLSAPTVRLGPPAFEPLQIPLHTVPNHQQITMKF